MAGAKGAQFAEAHAKLLADRSIQFDLPALARPQIPAWLIELGRWIDWAAPVLRILLWAGLACLGLFLIYAIGRRLSAGEWGWRRARATAADDAGWRPAEGPARALLGDADALAAEGRFAEAARLLLFRSIDEIESRHPSLVRPALTSRDIARAEPIPERARTAFAAIVCTVETSLFGGRDLALPDWRSCREAYERFAFAEAWR